VKKGNHSMPKAHSASTDIEENAKATEKRMSHKEAIEALNDIIGTPAPIQEADSLRKQVALVADQSSEVPPEIQAAVEDLQKRTKEAKK